MKFIKLYLGLPPPLAPPLALAALLGALRLLPPLLVQRLLRQLRLNRAVFLPCNNSSLPVVVVVG